MMRPFAHQNNTSAVSNSCFLLRKNVIGRELRCRHLLIALLNRSQISIINFDEVNIYSWDRSPAAIVFCQLLLLLVVVDAVRVRVQEERVIELGGTFQRGRCDTYFRCFRILMLFCRRFDAPSMEGGQGDAVLVID